MRIESGHRFLEICRSDYRRRLELDAARLVIQVNAEDLRGIARWQIDCFILMDIAAIAEHQPIPVRPYPLGLAFMEDTPPFFSRSVQNAHQLFSCKVQANEFLSTATF